MTRPTKLSQLIDLFVSWIQGEIRAGRVGPYTLERYRGELGRWLRSFPLDPEIADLTEFDLTGAGGITRGRVQAVKTFFKWSKRAKLVADNPFHETPLPPGGRRERVIKRDEMRRLLLSADPRPCIRKPEKSLDAGECSLCREHSTSLIGARLRTRGTQGSFDGDDAIDVSLCFSCRRLKRGLWKAKKRSLLEVEPTPRPRPIRPVRLILFAYAYSGARPGELCQLNWEHYDEQTRQFRLKKYKAKRRRSDRNKMAARVILVHRRLALLLSILRKKNKAAPNSPIFLNYRGNRWTCGALCKAVRLARKRAGLHVEGEENITRYHCRHTVGSNAARPPDKSLRPATAFEIAALLGHADVRSTQRYVHFGEGLPETLEAATAKPRPA